MNALVSLPGPARRHPWNTLRCLALLAAAASAGSPALALDTGPTVTGEICMQKLFGSPVANSNRVNCTAGDIRLSRVISVTPTACTEGTTFDLTATFEVNTTANSRYDAGFLFRIDGGLNARGDGTLATGECSLSALTVPPVAGSPALNLDRDSCGDLNAGVSRVTFTIPDVHCEDSDLDGKLNLPYCTSWHSNQGTQCAISDPFSVANASAFKPDTKSKCVCDDNFQLPVDVEEASLEVQKSASPTQVPEHGGTVTYTVTVKNLAEVESVIIDTLVDDQFGDLADAGNANVSENDCPDLVGETLGPGASLSCTFKAFIAGNAGQTHVNEVEVCATQTGFTELLCDVATAEVSILDEYTDPTVDKSASACALNVVYQVVVSNNSDIDMLTVSALTDDRFGDVASVHDNVLATTCSLPTTIATQDNYTCSFTGLIAESDCDFEHSNQVMADTVDEDGVADQTTSGTVTVTVSAGTP